MREERKTLRLIDAQANVHILHRLAGRALDEVVYRRDQYKPTVLEGLYADIAVVREPHEPRVRENPFIQDAHKRSVLIRLPVEVEQLS